MSEKAIEALNDLSAMAVDEVEHAESEQDRIYWKTSQEKYRSMIKMITNSNAKVEQMRFIEQPIPAFGDVTIARDRVHDNFQGCKIVQHGGTFRLHFEEGTDTTSLSIGESDALWIIDALGLGVSPCIALRRVVVWQ